MAIQRKQFAVIGLGRFGRSVCRTLHAYGHEVLGIDGDAEQVRSAQIDGIATHLIQADSTDIHALEEADLRACETVVVAIGTNLQASTLTVLNLIDLGITSIVAKASHEQYGKVLERVGGPFIQVVYPESQMGERVGSALSGADVLESIALSSDYSIQEILAPAELHGQSLQDADVRSRFGVTIIAIKSGPTLNIAPLGTDRIARGDVLTLLGPNDRLRAFAGAP